MKFELPTLVYQETNCIENHQKDLAGLGTKALIVTGNHSSKMNGSLEQVCSALSKEQIPYVIFDEIEENPSVETCVRAAALGKDETVDFVIGIGGGSPLDASKAISLLIANRDRDASIFYHPDPTLQKALPIASIPTTAGTGSEATPYAILTLHKEQTKRSISHRIFPELSLCDPAFLKSVPFGTLKNTAVDALAHLIESYLNTNATPYSRMFCEYGLSLWGKFREDLLDFALTDEEYAMMMETATLAGMAISHTGTSLPHGLSYLITYDQNLSHGAACGLFLPGYLFFCMKQEAMEITPNNLYITKEDTQKIFSLLGLKGIEEFSMMLYQLLGDFPVSEILWQKDVDSLLSNAAKLKNCPYPITREDLDAFI